VKVKARDPKILYGGHARPDVVKAAPKLFSDHTPPQFVDVKPGPAKILYGAHGRPEVVKLLETAGQDHNESSQTLGRTLNDGSRTWRSAEKKEKNWHSFGVKCEVLLVLSVPVCFAVV
jgi:hypothetical protein